MTLQFKRRARQFLVFAFKHYKYQTQRSKVASLLKDQAQSAVSMNIF
jgi:hypothetical protein